MRNGFVGGLGQVGDLAEFGTHPGGIDERASLTGNQRGTGKQQVFCVERRLFAHAFRVTGFRQGFTGDGRHIHANRSAGDQAAIRRNVIAFFQQDQITGNQQLDGLGGQFSVANELDGLWQQLAQRGDGLFSAIFLPERKRPIDQDHADDGKAQLSHAFCRVAGFGKKSQPGSDPQNQSEKVGELAQEAPPLRRAADLVDTVWSVFAPASYCLCSGQALLRRLEAIQSIRNGKVCDVHLPRLRVLFAARQGTPKTAGNRAVPCG